MPSTFTTDPIGPRSVDEMLDVVYGRADALQRRRTVQRLTGGIAAVVLAFVATLTLQGSDEGASVRSVDDPNGRQETSVPDDDGGGSGPPGGGQAPAAAPAGGAPNDARRATPSTVAARAVATTVPTVVAPPPAHIETWMAVGDAVEDATPNNWYYDIANTVMEYDPNRSVVVFTTSYRTPSGSNSGRQERALKSQFAFENTTHTVELREAGDQLGEIRLDDVHPCPGCSAQFDAGAGRLVVTVPVSVMNDVIGRESDARLGAGTRIDTLIATTAAVGAGGATIEADTASGGD